MPNSLIADCLELKRLGWVAIKGNLFNVAPKCMIFGGIFNNKEGKLPSKNGRVWYEHF